MCFVKSPKLETTEAPQTAEEKEAVVQQTQADASLTKASNKLNTESARRSIKTSPVGLQENAQIQKKTLLGE